MEFRTINISDASYESANLRFITLKTPNLQGRGDICVFVPPMENLKDIPVVILLHGVYGSAWSWAMRAGVHISAWEMMQKGEIQPMAIAMPSDGLWGDGSGYLPHPNQNFEKWIVEDVPEAVRQMVDAVSDASPLFISGLSMGGFGALRLGTKYGHLFNGISAHSSITGIDQMPLFVEEPLESYQQSHIEEETVWGMVQKHADTLPPLRFDCGSEDVLIEHNRLLHQQLVDAGIEHLYEEFSGGHEWPYWALHVKKSLKFFDMNG